MFCEEKIILIPIALKGLQKVSLGFKQGHTLQKWIHLEYAKMIKMLSGSWVVIKNIFV